MKSNMVDDSLLDTTLESLELPTRMRNWIARNGVETLRDLLGFEPEALLNNTSNLGRTSIEATDEIVRKLLGHSWRQLFHKLRLGDEEAKPIPAPRPVVSGEADPTLDASIDVLSLPARLCSYAEREGIETVRALVLRDPRDLLGARNLGRTSVQTARIALRAYLGEPWEAVRLRLLGIDPELEAPGPRDGPPALRWQRLAAAYSEAERVVALGVVDELPTRIKHFAQREGLGTVSALLAIPFDTLLASDNVGRKSLSDTLEALTRFLEVRTPEAPPGVPRAFSLDDHAEFLALWRARLARLPQLDRIVVQARSGLGEEPVTLAEAGEMLGVSRERVRQLETRALKALAADTEWLDALEARLRHALAGYGLALDELASVDPWLAPLAQERSVAGFLFARLLAGRFSFAAFDGREYLLALEPELLDERWRALEQGLAALPYPIARSALDEFVRTHGEPLGPALHRAFAARVRSVLQSDPEDPERVLGAGTGRLAPVLARLRAAPGPVRVQELVRLFGHGRLPEEAVYVARGLVTIVDKLPGFLAWGEALAGTCAAWMREHGPERQWSCEELLEPLRAAGPVPEWLGAWPLAELLRRRSEVRYLGRLAVVLPEVEGDRKLLRDLVVELLEAHGEPLPETLLHAQLLARRGATELAFKLVLQYPPLVEIEPSLWGLLARDVPGYPASTTRAETLLVELLGARGQGLSMHDALERLRAHDALFDGWTQRILWSVARHCAALRTGAQGVLGLAEWDTLRLPSRVELLRQCLAQGGGRCLVSAYNDRVEALYGQSPGRSYAAWMGHRLGVRVQGNELVQQDAEEQSSAPLLPGLTTESARVFARLCAEPLEDLAVLRARLEARLQSFYLEAVTNEAIDVQRAREVQRLCLALLEIAGPEASAQAKSYAQAATRYFLLDDDGAWDFGEGGLDDDLAVAEAVRAALATRAA